uniref:Uncharacterized protein n=1 Tax=Anopheles atroparvus TaxID=41427 RepID=A0A182JKS0_ANOAO
MAKAGTSQVLSPSFGMALSPGEIHHHRSSKLPQQRSNSLQGAQSHAVKYLSQSESECSLLIAAGCFPGNLPLHSLESRAFARPHGRSKWNGLQRSQSRPAVLCLQSQLSSPSLPAGRQRDACPLHLHRPPTAKSDTA